MPTDKEIALQNLDRQARSRGFALLEIPGYQHWSERKLVEGVSAALIENLDARSMWLLPQEVETVGEDDFEELLADLKDVIGNNEIG